MSAKQMGLARAFAHAQSAAIESRMAGAVALQTARESRQLESRHITWGIHAYESAAKQSHYAGLAAVYVLIGLLSGEDAE